MNILIIFLLKTAWFDSYLGHLLISLFHHVNVSYFAVLTLKLLLSEGSVSEVESWL